jgi:hypothetical protein
MSDINPTHLDKTGKVILDEVYNQKTPVSFYRAIEQLDYKLPQLAKPAFTKILKLLEQTKGRPDLKLVDLGCSYGVNATLLKWNFSLDEVFSHHRSQPEQAVDWGEQIRLDQSWLKTNEPRLLNIVGVDIAQNALDYALAAKIIDGMVCGNFENHTLDSTQRNKVRDADLLISTGCIGYVTQATIAALLDAMAPKQPWMVHFVLRMFSFDDVERLAKERGYETIKSRHPVRQRRFASMEEQQKALERLSAMSVDTKGYEDEGWYYADFFLSRPKGENQAPLPADLQELFVV